MSKEAASQAPEAAQAAAEAEKEAPKTAREKMFGDKIKKEPEKAAEKPEEKQEGKPEGHKEEPPRQQKKTASERVQELAREKNSEREARVKAEEESRKLMAELRELKAKDEKDKTPKDELREMLLEEKAGENMRKNVEELQKFSQSLGERSQEFNENYDYYAPALLQHDNQSMRMIWSYPQRFEMLDMLMNAINGGQFTLEEWVRAPMPVKTRKIRQLAEFVLNPQQPQNTEAAPAPQKKEVPDSLVPNLKAKAEPEDAGHEKGATFKKVFERGIGRR